MKTILSFLRSGTSESSKRLTMVSSYAVSLLICSACVAFRLPLDTNVLILLSGLCGISTSGYVVANKNEVK